MATKKLEGTLSITGKYAVGDNNLITAADYLYDPTKTYEAGQLCYYGSGDSDYFRCLEDGTTGTFGFDKWVFTAPSFDTEQESALFYQVSEPAQLVIELAGATITNDTTTHTIKIVKSGHVFPLDGTPADNEFLALLKGCAVRQVIWGSYATSAGLVAQVTFDSYFLDLSLVESEDIVSLQCYSPACKMTIVDETGSDGNTTIILHFTDDASSVDGNHSILSPYDVISGLIAMNQYDSVILNPVIAYMTH